MPRVHSLIPSVASIESFFDGLPQKAFTLKRLSTLIDDNKGFWDVNFRKKPAYIIDFLLDRGMLFKSVIYAGNAEETLYSWKTTDELTLITGLKWQSYYMYYTAMSLHDLTLQIPKTIYLNKERAMTYSSWDKPELSQESLDDAFSKDQRISENVYSIHDKKIVLTNTAYTGRLGVISYTTNGQSFFYTDLERTLIDCVVRPGYSGGVTEVLDAYRQARGKLDVNKLMEYLMKLEYVYPYHQAIGFYLEKAGYGESDLEVFSQPMDFDFYLTYHIRNKEYSERWKLYFPKGF